MGKTNKHYPHKLSDKIKVDMDYCSSPLWCCQDETTNVWTNDTFEDYKPFISSELYYSLSVYQRVWEDLYSDIDIQLTLNSLVQLEKSLVMMQLDLAMELKKELPLKRIFICYRDYDREKYQEREIIISEEGDLTVIDYVDENDIC